MVLKFVMKRQTVTDANGIGEHPLSHASSGCNTPHDRERGSSVGSDGHLSDGHPPTTRRLSGYDSPTEHATHETNGDTTGTDLAVLNRHLRRRVSELQERTELQGAELRELVEAADTTDETSDEVNQLRWRCKQLELQMAEHDRERRCVISSHVHSTGMTYMQRTCNVHATYMQPTSNAHAAYMQRTCNVLCKMRCSMSLLAGMLRPRRSSSKNGRAPPWLTRSSSSVTSMLPSCRGCQRSSMPLGPREMLSRRRLDPSRYETLAIESIRKQLTFRRRRSADGFGR